MAERCCAKSISIKIIISSERCHDLEFQMFHRLKLDSPVE